MALATRKVTVEEFLALDDLDLRLMQCTGVAEVWLVDPEADQVLVHRRSTPEAPTFDGPVLRGRDEVLTTLLLPGLAIDLEALFDR